MRRTTLVVVIVVAVVAFPLLAGTSSLSFAVGGALDPSFDGDGKVLTDFFGSFDAALEVASYPGGKTVVGGVAHRLSGRAEFAVARYNADGSLDPTFEDDGMATAAFGTCDAWAFGLGVLPNGKIVLGGASYGRLAGDECGTEVDFALARFNRDGSLDTSFDGDGRLTTDFGAAADGSLEEIHGLAVRPQGTITAVGVVSGGQGNFGLARYNPDGTLDNSFDGDGKVVTDFGGGEDPSSVAITPTGQIVVVGLVSFPGTADFGVARYNSDGSLDTSFDGDGKVTTDFGTDGDGSLEEARDVAIESNGRIVAVGATHVSFQDDFAVARYNSDGSLDASFDGDGKVTTDFGISETARAVSTYPNGNIVAAGGTGGGATDFALARYKSDGSLDLSFDADGRVVTDFGAQEYAFGVAIQTDGSIVAAGPASGDFAVARYLGR
jgi:uncharacterized delta-60 repeat protein